jgi:DNA end-binding protein Ku
MPRASWKGFIRLSLVSVPVQAFTANNTAESSVTLNQLHAECHNRIRYQKTCPVHGEVPNEEIVRGYEYAKGQYAIIDLDELESLRSARDKSISIDRFFRPDDLDVMFYAGRTYFLTPDGVAGQKPYALLQRGMGDQNLFAIAQVVFLAREQLVVLRPVGDLLAMSVLHFPAEVKSAETFAELVGKVDYSDEELKLTKTLIEATTADQLQLDQYHDKYAERLSQLVEAKVAGKEIVTAPDEPMPAVINLMDALKASVEAAQTQPTKAAQPEEGQRKLAASATRRKPARKSKKTG